MSKRSLDRPVVCVFGGSDAEDGGELFRTAYAVGRKLAELGYVVANGGYTGTMEASARGAKDAGGTTVGVTCSIWSDRANRYIDEVIPTQNLTERVARLVELGRCGYVVLPGANGTLSELAQVWERKTLRQLQGRPVVCVGRFWQPTIEAVCLMRPASREHVACVETAEELERFFPRRSGALPA